MLEVANLNVRYDRVHAVRDASLEVRPGHICALVGPNGAGKSSLLRALVGLHRPSSGTIRFAGKTITGLAPERIVREGISIVPEGRQAFARLTVVENLKMGLVGRRGSRGASDLDRIVERFPVLGTYFHHVAGALSGGEQQQLVIARALLTKPKLLILDEPSLGLAPIVVSEVFATLAELREQGTTILLVEQNAAKALGFADDAYLMSNGRVTPRDTSVGEKELLETYLGTAP
ncbi:ABC transporter ATP-binding protein [Mycobacterium aquaticum]|uniref:ABC transporter domain-containing protein n=1 Tax=Mycobacterium aquaticum TaxID=1927124 RepID=A0A1X0BAK6_9MYCO|nr:ABC transporter ATP-binding protein [Mycobacterium aquaticum]ORA39239.1 hypothetical protein BST13_02960 [Mycobacterium aquaticum]